MGSMHTSRAVCRCSEGLEEQEAYRQIEARFGMTEGDLNQHRRELMELLAEADIGN